MIEFEIKPFTGNKIPGKGNLHITHWAVFVINQLNRDWIFLKSFLTQQRAKDFIEDVKTQIEEGDYSCLTLK